MVGIICLSALVGIGLIDLHRTLEAAAPCPLVLTALLYISIRFVVEDNRHFHRQSMSKEEPISKVSFFAMSVCKNQSKLQNTSFSLFEIQIDFYTLTHDEKYVPLKLALL